MAVAAVEEAAAEAAVSEVAFAGGSWPEGSAEARSRAEVSATASRARRRSAPREFKATALRQFKATALRAAVSVAIMTVSATIRGRNFFVGGYFGPDYYDDYYDYPGYVADDSYYDNGGCYVVQRRVHTRHGWRLRPVQVCG